jgi:hypothetical protein
VILDDATPLRSFFLKSALAWNSLRACLDKGLQNRGKEKNTRTRYGCCRKIEEWKNNGKRYRRDGRWLVSNFWSVQ